MSTTNVNTATTTTPLLSMTGETASFPRLVNTRRMMSQQSLRVRQSVAQQIDERRKQLAESKSSVVVDLVWNAFSVLCVIVVMIQSRDEITHVPLRLWLDVYGILRIIHMLCVFVEYRRRRELTGIVVGSLVSSLRSYSNLNLGSGSNSNSNSNSSSNLSSSASVDAAFVEFVSELRQVEDNSHNTSFAKHLETANSMLSFIWWIIGIYWILSGGKILADDAPKLYRLTTFFLECYVFFVVVIICLACIVGIAICFCLPCILIFLCSMTYQEATSEEVFERLKRFNFRRLSETEKPSGELQEPFGGIMIECNTDTPTEHALSAEDAACAICLCEYDNESELNELPCHHHFHSACIRKWLLTKPTCPLCKYDLPIIDNQSSNEV